MAYQDAAVFIQTNDGRREDITKRIRNQMGATIPPEGDQAVGGPKIDAD